MLVMPADAKEVGGELGALFGPLEEDVSEVSMLGEGPPSAGEWKCIACNRECGSWW